MSTVRTVNLHPVWKDFSAARIVIEYNLFRYEKVIGLLGCRNQYLSLKLVSYIAILQVPESICQTYDVDFLLES